MQIIGFITFKEAISQIKAGESLTVKEDANYLSKDFLLFIN